MRYDRSDKLLSDAFNVIAKYDASLYARMTADDWQATTHYEDLPPRVVALFRDTSEGELYGQTSPKLCAGDMLAEQAFGPDSRVTLGSVAITKRARSLGVPVAMFAAMVLAHEYQHIGQPQCSGNPFTMEPPAYDAGIAFARRLPAPHGARIAELGEEDKIQQVMAALFGGYS